VTIALVDWGQKMPFMVRHENLHNFYGNQKLYTGLITLSNTFDVPISKKYWHDNMYFEFDLKNEWHSEIYLSLMKLLDSYIEVQPWVVQLE